MSRTREEIVVELIDLCAQYKAEVPGRSQAWPKSIKERVAELHAMGLGDTEISRHVPISAQTMYSWRQGLHKKSLESFLPVKIVQPSTVTVKKMKKAKVSTVTVITPQGYRIEGLDSKSAVDFIAKLEAE